MKTYRRIVRDLSQVYPDGEARALARWLCEERLGLSQTDLLLDKDNELSADDIEVLKEITSRLVNHEPIQYILGYTDFCGHRFCVAPGVLIPRPETEQLVRLIVESVTAPVGASDICPAAPVRPAILDVGTGSGCIALSLAMALPGAEVTGWDVSPAALAVARRNAGRYPEAHVRFAQVDVLASPPDEGCWDLIVSNPPYVRQSEARSMARNVLDYEPHLALFVPDDDPLRFYHAITRHAQLHLAEGGTLWFEVNEAYGEEIARFIEENGFCDVAVIPDQFGHVRFVSGTKR